MSKLIKSEVRSRLGVDLRSRPIPTVTTMPAGGSPPGHTGCQRQLKTDPLTASEKLTPWLVIGHRCLLLMFGRGLGL